MSEAYEPLLSHGDNTTWFENTTQSLSVGNSTDNFLDIEYFTRFKIAKWLDTYSTYILTSVALLGNSVALITICSMKPITSTSIYIATLAVTDTMCLLCKLLAVHLVRYPSLPEEVSCGLMLFLFFFAQYSASWLIVIISLERFVAVWFPLRVSLISTKRHAVLFLVIGSLIFIGPSVWTFWLYARLDHDHYGPVCVIRLRYDVARAVLKKLHPILYIILPFVLILVTNVLIIFGLRKARRFGQQVKVNGFRTRGRYQAPSKMTAMLLTTAFVFLLLELLMVILTLFRHYSDAGLESFVEDYFFVEMAQTLEDTNHAVNFFLYFCSGAKFRETFLCLIRGKSCRTPTYPRQLTWSSRMSSYRDTSTRGESIKMVAKCGRETSTRGDSVKVVPQDG